MFLADCHSVDVAHLALAGDSKYFAQHVKPLQPFVFFSCWFVLPSGRISFFLKTVQFLLELVKRLPELTLLPVQVDYFLFKVLQCLDILLFFFSELSHRVILLFFLYIQSVVLLGRSDSLLEFEQLVGTDGCLVLFIENILFLQFRNFLLLDCQLPDQTLLAVDAAIDLHDLFFLIYGVHSVSSRLHWHLNFLVICSKSSLFIYNSWYVWFRIR